MQYSNDERVVLRMPEDAESMSQSIAELVRPSPCSPITRRTSRRCSTRSALGDSGFFRRLLSAHNVLEHCEEVCEWIRSKDCVLLCLELAGPPPEGELPPPLEFAQAVERVTANVDLLERLAASVSERNPKIFQAFIAQSDLSKFAHLLCHWACTVNGRLLCELVCSPEPGPGSPW